MRGDARNSECFQLASSNGALYLRRSLLLEPCTSDQFSVRVPPTYVCRMSQLLEPSGSTPYQFAIRSISTFRM